ncbi:hypothetical protein PCANC_21732 [Puccinia coronata f. sp. avenae]|uniref:Uncharacterized protein n=1 Tax=Puccinia coronata f. sp. avenae TaxID=200324 RepID=A0A2N5S4N1_9BASI|nr:hypothetical protein PCANC_21732 [Puccinia coronata f. sp. avenae]
MRTPQFFLKSYTAALIILLTKRILHITTSTLITPELSAISRAPDEAACNSNTVRAAFPAVGSNSCLSGQVDQRRTPNGLMLDEVGWHSSPIVHDHLQLQRNRENLEVWDGAMFLCGYPLTPSHFSEDEYYHTYRNGPQQLKHNRFEPHDVQSTNQETVSSGESSKRQKDRSNSSEDATPAPDFGEFFDWFLSDRSNVDSAAGTVERKRGDETDSNQMKYFAKNKEKSVDSQISEVTPVTHYLVNFAYSR